MTMIALLQPLPPVRGPARERYEREVPPDYAAMLDALHTRLTHLLQGIAAADTWEELRAREARQRRAYLRLSRLCTQTFWLATGTPESGGVGAGLDLLDLAGSAILDEARTRLPADDIAVVRFLITTMKDAHRAAPALARRYVAEGRQAPERLQRACERLDSLMGLAIALAVGNVTLANPALLDPVLVEAKEHALEYAAALAAEVRSLRGASEQPSTVGDAAEEIALAEADAADDLAAFPDY